ncbi:TPA: GlxA family transcriptional regulator [Burkholderia cepacia]|uniref:GlxA family transcriptional regulator n=1 Tax=Burkholderia cepacia TaxID=292 RepID=UPI001CF1FE74|nr:GlxA family transcriptional regulator [Burkholderia cepacia]MCA8360221.1 GlxA family transcriptional regulator [Burkholderia cepacia]HDR9759637.1 GlxA family transcriptional regulator [Burkholderia cepacia ATCC 25416]HDV6368193.1 GlxA family transcriptional regulator [Burkholderia cepacia]
MFPFWHDELAKVQFPSVESQRSAGSASTHPVHLVIYPGFKLMEAVGPVSVLSYANRHLAAQGDTRRYAINLVAPTPGAISSDTLISLDVSAGLPEDEALSTVLIAGALDIESAVARETALVDWVRRRSIAARRFAALCSGSFFLATAGVLSGRRAATHWSVATLLQQRFPSVEVDADAIFIQEDNIWTSAGVTAAIDLTLAFVEQDFGRNLALAVARDLVIYLKRPGGQSQFSDVLNSQMTAAPEIRDVQTWVSSNLSKPLQLEDMAEKAGMSVRNFTRLFKEEVGMPPTHYLVRARCERAATLLLDSDLPLKTIASRVGFPTEEQMRKVFVRHFSLTPRAYRARFSTTSLKTS